MAVKHNSLYLFLALACFVGIILIFIFDGYIGIYDSLTIDNGQYRQTVEYDQWAREEKFGGYVGTGVDQGGQVEFTYTIENHRFTEYRSDIAVTLWQNKVQIGDISFIPDAPLVIPAFGKRELTWSVKPSAIFPSGYPPEQSYYVIMKIERGDIERSVNINIQALPATIKTIPVPVPQQ